MFRKLYDWTLHLAGHRHALRSLALISFAESSFFPIPPDVMVIPMVLARRDQAWRIAAVAGRSEERRVGKECELKCRSRWSPYH